MDSLHATRNARFEPAATPVIRRMGPVDYEPTWRAMREFTLQRGAATPDELWVLQHPAVYTLGVAARAQHLPRIDNGIPVVKTDRGVQITYHSPGQPDACLRLHLHPRQ